MAWTFKATVTATNSGAEKTNYSHRVFLSPASTTVDVEAASGQKVVPVAATTNFSAGDHVILDTGGANEEWGQIDTISAGVSITLLANLTNTHAVSTNVDNADQHIVDNTQATGADIRFTPVGVTTSVLDHFIGSWDATKGYRLYVEIPTIGAAGSTDVDLHYGGGAVASTSDVEATFLKGIDFTDKTQVISDITDSGLIRLFNVDGISANPLVQISDFNASDSVTSFREQDDILRDPGAASSGGNYKFYFTTDVTAVPDNAIAVAQSSDAAFTTPSYQLVTGISDDVQDPSVVQTISSLGKLYRDANSDMYLYSETNSNNNINVYRSDTVGTAFTLIGANVIAQGSSVGDWDNTLVGSPVGRHDGTNFIIGYEGRDSNIIDGFGIATGTGSTSLTKSTSNPLFLPSNHSQASASIVVDGFYFNGSDSKFYFTIHEGAVSTRTMYRAMSSVTDPTAWSSTDIVEFGTERVTKTLRNDFTMDLATGGLSRVITTNESDTAIYITEVSGPGASWAVERLAETHQQGGAGIFSPSSQSSAQNRMYFDSSNDFNIQPYSPNSTVNNSGDYTIALRINATIGVPNKFEIVSLMHATPQANDEYTGLITFGSQSSYVVTTTAGAETGAIGGFKSGYTFLPLRPGDASGIRLYDIDTSGSQTQIDTSNFAAANSTTWQKRRFSYTSAGVLAVTVGTDTAGATDTSFITGNKYVGFSVGQRYATNVVDIAGHLRVAYFAVRNFDGTEATSSFGQPVAENISEIPSTATTTVRSLLTMGVGR